MKFYSLPLLLLLCSSILSVKTVTSDEETITAVLLYQAENKSIEQLNKSLDTRLDFIHTTQEEVAQEEVGTPQEEVNVLTYMSFSTTHTLMFVVTIIGFAMLCKNIDLAAGLGFCTVVVLLPYFFRTFILHISALLFLFVVVADGLKNHPALKDKPERLEIAEMAAVIGYLAVGKFIGTIYGGGVWFYLAGIMILIISVSQKSSERDITVIMKDILLRKEVPNKADITTIICLGIKVFTALVMLLIASDSTDVLTALACFVTVNYEIRRSLFLNGDRIKHFASTQSIISITVWIAFLVLNHSYFLMILTLPVTIIQILDNYDVYKTKSIQYTITLVFIVISEDFQYTILSFMSYALLVLFPFTLPNRDRVTLSCSLAIFAVVLLPVSFKFITTVYSALMSIATSTIASIATITFLRLKKSPTTSLIGPCCQRIVGCSACMERWLATSSTCPNCNKRASRNKFKEVKRFF